LYAQGKGEGNTSDGGTSAFELKKTKEADSLLEEKKNAAVH